MSFVLMHKFLYVFVIILTIPVFFAIVKITRQRHVDSMKNRIQKAQEDFSNNVHFEPFININKEPWQVLELLPGVTRAQAKNLAMQIYEIRKVEKFDEFRKIVGLEKALCEINKKIVKFN
jgi:hypothetical protein